MADEVARQVGVDVRSELGVVRRVRVERVDNDSSHQIVATGEWRRWVGGPRQPLEIHFPEISAGRLRLVVIDHRNPPLHLTAVRYTAVARQVVFAASADLAAPLRLYFGNPRAAPPHYDFAANMPAVLEPVPLGRTTAPPRKPPLPARSETLDGTLARTGLCRARHRESYLAGNPESTGPGSGRAPRWIAAGIARRLRG